MIFGILGMGCDFCWADCLSQDLQDFGDGQDGRRGVGELPILFFYSDSFSRQAVSPISSIS